VKAFPEFRMPHDFIPDVVLFAGSALTDPKPLFVEIVVSNPIHQLKQRRIRRFGVPTIEIRLSHQDLALSPKELLSKLEGLSMTKQWVFHPAQIACEMEFVADYRRRRHDATIASRSQITKEVSHELRNRIRSKKAGPPTGLAACIESEHSLQRFFDKHQRYPSLQESRALRQR
jgi:hypothetical protein